MGPISLGWYEKHNIPFEEVTEPSKFTESGFITRKKYKEHYYGGRIDVNNGVPFGTEIGVPIMDGESWSKFQEFCDNLKTETVLSLWEIEILFVAQTGFRIKWFNEKS